MYDHMKRRHPVESGRMPDCKIRAMGGVCFTDLHHEVWPRRFYRSRIEKKFRELICNKTVVCRAFHDEIHATLPPPVKPSRDQMCEMINQERNK